MSDDTVGAVSAPAPAAAPVGWIGGFPPAALVREAPAIPAQEDKAAPAPVLPAQEAAKPQPLAELIKQTREARQAKAQEEARAKDLQSKYDELQAKMDQLQRDSDFENDPVAYAKARGWDKEKQLLMGQMLLYDLAPDKAPQDLRLRMFESKQQREKREAEEQRKAEETQRIQQGQQETYQAFVAAIDQTAAAFEPGSYPESQAWFINPESGEVDHDTYVRSLVATAVNMANAAQRENRVADLSPASIAKTLEAEVARRMSKRDEAKAKRMVKAPAAPEMPVVKQEALVAGGVQPTESTQGTYGSGAPRPQAKTDQERLNRAMAVAFRTPGSR